MAGNIPPAHIVALAVIDDTPALQAAQYTHMVETLLGGHDPNIISHIDL